MDVSPSGTVDTSGKFVEQIPTGHGVVYFTDKGYEYQTKVTYKNTGNKYLICTKALCEKTLTIDTENGNEVMRGDLGYHVHTPEEGGRDRRWIIARIYERVTTELTDLSVIFLEETRGYSEAVTSKLCEVAVLEKCNRWRRTKFPALPRSIAEFGTALGGDIARNFGLSHRGEPFYRQRVGNHSVLFVSESMKNLLTGSNVVLNCDGTFKAVPNIPEAKQLLTIMAPFSGVALPVCWAVMRRKNRSCYRDVLLAIKSVVPEMNPKGVILDFEAALHRAFKDIFPDIHLYGCYFHYVQALCRNRTKYGLRRDLLLQNASLMRIFQMAKALPFLKAADISEGIKELEMLANEAVDAKPFVQYLKRIWEPKAMQLSVYRRLRRTNNEIEVYHRNIMTHMRSTSRGGNRPPTWLFMGGLQSIEQKYSQKYNNISAGTNRKPYKKPSYIGIFYSL